MKFEGWDLALNHSGFVVINKQGKLDSFSFTTTIKKVAEAWGGDLMPEGACKSKEHFNARRLGFLSGVFDPRSDCPADTYVAIEDYAYGAKTNSAYQIGEVGGAARVQLMSWSVPFKAWKPTEVKKFATGRGRCVSKADMIDVCREEFGKDWAKYDCGLKSSETAGDLADAHILAHMARCQYFVANELKHNYSADRVKIVEGSEFIP